MTTISWIKINPNITVSDTCKKFYGKYLYKVKIFAPGYRVAAAKSYENKRALAKEIALLRRNSANWGSFSQGYLSDADIDQLIHLKSEIFLSEQSNDKFLLRNGGPHLTIYANSEDALKKIASKSGKRVLSITRPSDDQIEDLNNDVILLKFDNGFKYKIVTRDRLESKNTRQQLHGYLTALGNEVKMTPGYDLRLTSQLSWLPSSYIYCNDRQIEHFIRLIAPNLILKIFELKVIH